MHVIFQDITLVNCQLAIKFLFTSTGSNYDLFGSTSLSGSLISTPNIASRVYDQSEGTIAEVSFLQIFSLLQKCENFCNCLQIKEKLLLYSVVFQRFTQLRICIITKN